MARCGMLVLTLAAVLVVAYAEDDAAKQAATAKSRALFQKCLAETKTTKENVLAYANKETYPPEINCLHKCFLMGNKSMLEDGTIDVDRVVQLVSDKYRATAEKCKTTATATDLCERAGQYQTCFLENEPDFVKATVNKLVAA